VFLEILARRGNEVFVAALWGPQSDWYRNLEVAPAIGLQVGNEILTPPHRFVTDAEAQPLLDRYQERHPRRVRVRKDQFIRRPLGATTTPVVAFQIGA
jgi:F420H(2)-dependent quinone reductase